MSASDSSDGNKKPSIDILPLIEEGHIAAARLDDNSFSIDRDIFDVLIPRLRLTPIDQVVYLQLYRHSFGRGLNCAQVSNTELQRLCNVSHSTIRESMKRLRKKGCIKLVRRGIQHDACIYRILLPNEVLQYQSATKVSYNRFDPETLVERARRLQPEPEQRSPEVQFKMLRG